MIILFTQEFNVRYLAFALSLAVMLAGSSAQAQYYNSNNAPANPPQINMPSGLGSTENARRWTARDLQAVCSARWGTETRSYASCFNRNSKNIGKNMTPGEAQELQMLLPPAPPQQRPKDKANAKDTQQPVVDNTLPLNQRNDPRLRPLGASQPKPEKPPESPPPNKDKKKR